MVNNKGLAPGLYVQRGDSVKAITTSMLPNGEFRSTGVNQSVESLANVVGFVYGALNARRAEMTNVAAVTRWQRGDVEQPSNSLGFSIWDELPRIDTALQNYGVAYYYKNTTLGNGIVLQWFDPASTKPDRQSGDGRTQQYTNYKRSLAGGRMVNIPADDLIVIQTKGMRELSPMSPAGMATSLAAQILHSMDSTIDDLYDRNFMPIQLIHIPQGTEPEQQERLESRFRRLFSRRRTNINKTIAVERGPTGDTVGVTAISLAPDDLELTATRDAMADQILFAHGVPVSALRTNSNRDTSTKSISFTETIASRADMIARTINADIDVQRQRLELVVHSSKLRVFQLAELEQAKSVQSLTGVPVLTPNEGREIIGREPLVGEEYERLHIPQPQQSSLGLPVRTAAKGENWLADMRMCKSFVRDGRHKKRWFNSNELSDADIQGVIDEFEAAMVEASYP